MITNQSVAEKILGIRGKLISGSKSGYKNLYPNNLVVFNSNICTEKGKFWYGDIDASKSLKDLIILAKEIGETVYVLYEMDGRFENEESPLLSKYVIKIEPDGNWEIADNIKQYFKNFPN